MLIIFLTSIFLLFSVPEPIGVDVGTLTCHLSDLALFFEKTPIKNTISESSPVPITEQEQEIIIKIVEAADKLEITILIAGGFVRDRLLGAECNDLDFVCDKDSEILAKFLAEKYHLKHSIQLSKSGASMVVFNNQYIDLIDVKEIFNFNSQLDSSSLEKDGEWDFTLFLDDAFRRDLTINSLFYCPKTNKIVDLTGKGLDDLNHKILRTTIDPMIKYRIHATDILRALRFYATKEEFTFADGMLEAMRINAHRLKPREDGGDVSARRIERELRKACITQESWKRMKEMLIEIGLQDIIALQIETVDHDFRKL